jgi:hypothetical protein
MDTYTDYLAYWDSLPSWCSRCEQEKPAREFALEARRGVQPWCRQCKTEYQRERRRKNRTQGNA